MQPMVNDSKHSDFVKASFLPWVVCFSASLFLFYEFIQGNMFPSIADNIMRDFHIQADKMTYLSSVYYISNAVFLFVAGFLLDRFSTKRIILIAMLLCVLSTFLLAYSHSFYIALFCRFVTGVGSAFCFLGPIRIASRWFPAERMALVTGAVVTMGMIGGMLAQYPLATLVLQIGWREALVYVGWLGMVMLAFMVVWLKEGPETPKKVSDSMANALLSIKNAYLNTQNIRAALYTSLMNMPVAILGAMIGSLYIVQRLDVSKQDASMVNTVLFLGAMIGGPLIGWCSDKLGLRVLPMKICAVAALFTVVGIIYLPVSFNIMMVLFFLLGFFTAAQVISYALVAESSPPLLTATALSLISLLTQGGYAVYQNLFSRILMWHGEMQVLDGVPVYSLNDYQMATFIMPIGLIVALFVLFKLKETYGRPLQQG